MLYQNEDDLTVRKFAAGNGGEPDECSLKPVAYLLPIWFLTVAP